ncbi:MAG: Beta-lactamase [Bacteroidetes bacterium]|nr:Beta-lactamase [Bacteroidota bacterium]
MKKLLLIIALGATVITHAQTDLQKAERIDSIFKIYAAKNHFNGSVLVAKKDKILLSKGYGMANFSYEIPNSPSTKFKLASVSKQFTALSILMLEEKGKLSLDDKLTKFIPDYPNGDKVTVHHLLTHTSGIPNVTSLPIYDTIMTQPHTQEKLIGYTKNKALEFEPGTKFSYSNTGYILLSYIVEKVSGKEFGDFLKSNIFVPLGMKNSGLWHSREVVKNAAVGYCIENDKFQEVRYIDMSIPAGAGAIYSTVEDMYLWDRSFYSEKLVKKSTIEKMTTPFKENYAYGLKVEEYAGHKLITHSGGIEGFATIAYHFPDEQLYIVILKNVDNQKLFPAHKISRAVMYGQKFDLPKERQIAEVNKKVFDGLVGDYELQPGFILTISTSQGKIFAQATGQPKIEIYPEAEYKYFAKAVDAQMEFTKDEKGNTTILTLLQGGAKMPAKRIK